MLTSRIILEISGHAVWALHASNFGPSQVVYVTVKIGLDYNEEVHWPVKIF